MTYAMLAEWDQAARQRKGVSVKQAEAVRYSWDRVLEVFERRDPTQLTYQQIVDYLDARLMQVSGQTARKEIQALRRGITQARKRRYHIPKIEDWPEIPTSPKNKMQAGTVHPLPVLRRWLAELREPSDALAARKRSPLAAIQAEFILLTGLRATEAQRLRLAWVEPAPEGSDVPAFLRLPVEATKTRRERVLGLPHRALALLLEASDLQPDEEPLFPGTYQKARNGAARRIGYDQHITLRDLRHSFATYSGKGGVSVQVLRQALGHTDLRTTSIYDHGLISEAAIAPLAVASLLEGGGDPSAGTPQEGDPLPFDESAVALLGMSGRGGGIRTHDFLLPKQAVCRIMELLRDPEGSQRLLRALEGAGLVAGGGDPRRGPLREVG